MSEGETLCCSRCSAGINPHEDRYVIGFHRPLKRLEWIYLCSGCAEELRGWLSEST